MEIRVESIQLPERIGFNYEELKKELTEKVSMYETMIYTDDQIKEAKADKANLNKLKKALNDERIRREKEYMQPFNDFKAKVNEIISIIDKPVAVIDKQVKEYEEKQKQDKRNKISEIYTNLCVETGLGVGLEQIWNDKWLNASVSLKSIQEEMTARFEQIAMDIKIINDLPEYSFEAKEMYERTLDVRSALAEANRLAEMTKRKAEQERLAAEAEAKRQEEQLPGQMGFHDAESFEKCVNPQMDELPFDADRSGDEPVANPTIVMPQEEVSEDYDNFIPDFANEPEKKWTVLKVNVTPANETELLRFLEERNIEFCVL
jgi:hypothetical protein